MKIFLGSSRESTPTMDWVAMCLEDLGHEAVKWNQPGLFPPGESTLSRLIEISQNIDAAAFIFSEDDKLWYRGDATSQPRDNVLIEWGLFTGHLGPKKSIICIDGSPKESTDLRGLTYIEVGEKKQNRARIELREWASGLRSHQLAPPLSTSSPRGTRLFRRSSREIEFRELAENVSSIDMIAWSFGNFWDLYAGFIQSKIETGCKVRIMIVSDTGLAAKVITKNSAIKELTRDIKSVKLKASKFCQRLEGASGTFELREIDWVPSLGLVIFDSSAPNGIITVGIQPLYLPAPRDTRRMFVVKRQENEDDFEYFRAQFEELWRTGEVLCQAPQRSMLNI